MSRLSQHTVHQYAVCWRERRVMWGQKRIEVSTSVQWAKCHLRNHRTSYGLQDLAEAARATQFKGTGPDHGHATSTAATHWCSPGDTRVYGIFPLISFSQNSICPLLCPPHAPFSSSYKTNCPFFPWDGEALRGHGMLVPSALINQID